VSNLFDATNYPEGIPGYLVIGDRWVWKRTDLGGDYDPALYTLSYSLRRYGSGDEVTVTATASGTEYLVAVASTTTDDHYAGWYEWQAYITRDSDSERFTVDTGRVELVTNRDANPDDPRNHNRRMLDLLTTAIEALAAKTHRSYSIGDRSMTYTDLPELREQRDLYASRVDGDERAERAARGEGGGHRIRVRLHG